MKIQNDWLNYIGEEFNKSYYLLLKKFLIEEYNNQVIYPKADDIFNAFHLTSFENTSVVILGQDPYHGINQAHGLSFSVKKGTRIPPSLNNIFKEINSDLGVEIPKDGDLTKWASQGVLLLNTVLTVRQGQAHSHKNRGWETFTDRVIESLNEKKDPVVFLLWGKPAQSKIKLIDKKKHFILTAPHPSPLSAYRGFLGCKHFSKTNKILESIGKKTIDWNLV